MQLQTIILLYNLLLYSFVFILGICIGSFLNVCIYRIPNNISIAKGRSFCPNCNHQLGVLDLVPLFSYLLLGRKCRYCHKPISPRYFTVEFLAGLLYVWIFHIYGMEWITVLHWIFVSVLIIIGFIDYDTMDIYDYNHIGILILGCIRTIFIKDISLSSQIIGMLCISIPLLVIYFVVKGGIGGGDVKLMASCGFYLGFPNTILSFLIGTITAAIYALILIVLQKKTGKDTIAFGPFLCIGFITALLYGQQIITWYINLL